MLKIFVADQCTKRHNKNSHPTWLDVFAKNRYALVDKGGGGKTLIHNMWIKVMFFNHSLTLITLYL